MKDIKCENSTPIDERNQLVPRLIIGPNHILRTGFMVSSVRFMKPPVQPAKDQLGKTQEEVKNSESYLNAIGNEGSSERDDAVRIAGEVAAATDRALKGFPLDRRTKGDNSTNEECGD
jgi:hypothetical protein